MRTMASKINRHHHCVLTRYHVRSCAPKFRYETNFPKHRTPTKTVCRYVSTTWRQISQTIFNIQSTMGVEKTSPRSLQNHEIPCSTSRNKISIQNKFHSHRALALMFNRYEITNGYRKRFSRSKARWASKKSSARSFHKHWIPCLTSHIKLSIRNKIPKHHAQT